MSTLYLVSTPIGNVEDLSPRARRVLCDVDRVAAEDTRRTGRLLDRLGIEADLVSLHRHNEAKRTERLLGWLAEGLTIGLVSDAGTPLVSDPGARLVRAARDAGHDVVPIPGPSAVLAGLAASGLPWERFTFLGFLPRKGRERGQLLRRIAASTETSVLFESPERTVALLEALIEVCGEGREASVGRELTKLHEEIRTGTLAELLDYYGSSGVRGEVTVCVAAASAADAAPDRAEAPVEARRLLEGGMKPSAAAREIARRFGIDRASAYGIVQEAGSREGDD